MESSYTLSSFYRHSMDCMVIFHQHTLNIQHSNRLVIIERCSGIILCVQWDTVCCLGVGLVTAVCPPGLDTVPNFRRQLYQEGSANCSSSCLLLAQQGFAISTMYLYQSSSNVCVGGTAIFFFLLFVTSASLVYININSNYKNKHLRTSELSQQVNLCFTFVHYIPKSLKGEARLTVLVQKGSGNNLLGAALQLICLHFEDPVK